MSVESETSILDFDIDLSERTRLLLRWLFRIGFVGILVAVFTAFINFGSVEWFYTPFGFDSEPIPFHLIGDTDSILPYYNPIALLVYGNLTVISCFLIIPAALASYIRYRNPLAIITAILFAFTAVFTVGWIQVLPEDMQSFTYPVMLEFASYNALNQFIEDVAWAATSYMIAFMFLGLTFFHVFSGPRKKQDLRMAVIGMYMVISSLFALMVPHLGFLWDGPELTWISASLVWLVQAIFIALPGYWLLSKEI